MNKILSNKHGWLIGWDFSKSIIITVKKNMAHQSEIFVQTLHLEIKTISNPICNLIKMVMVRVVFYGIPTLINYLMPNLVFIYIYIYI